MNPTNSILAMKARLLKAWGLRDQPPFRGVPSGDITELMRVFVNRGKEMQRAILTLDEGENILVRGMTGIGKTAFIMAVLYQIEQQAKMLHQDILPIHIRQFAGGTRDDFYRVILYALAKQLGPTNKQAREIVYALTGEEITRGRSGGLSAGIEIGVSPLFKATTQGEIGKEQSKVLKIVQPEHFLGKLLDDAAKKYRRVIFAVDDLERVPNQGSIKLMLESALDLIRDKRCAFILTGRTLTILEDVYASGLDIFNEVIPLQPLSSEELRLIICGKILKIAIEHGAEELTRDVFERSFEYLQDEIAAKDVPPDIRRIIYLGLQQGGFSVAKDADLDQVFNIIGIATRKQFVDFADNLVQQDLLQRITDERGEILYRLAPGVEKLAQSGASLEGGSANSSNTP